MTVCVAKTRWIVLVGLAGLLGAGRAYAQTTPCNTDIDCPGTACGGQVCVKSSGGSMCTDPNTSHASGIDDGWCADSSGAKDSNCKCQSMGAICNGFYCSFTIPQDGGATGTGGGAGGSSGTGGSGTGGSGTGGSGTGTGGSAAGTSGGSGGGGGGCSVAGTSSAAGLSGATLLLALALMRRRRR